MSDLKPSWTGSEVILNRLMEVARSSALAEMASGIAHELNQPLGAIATFSQAGDRLLNRAEPRVAHALDVFRQINSEAMNAGEGIRRIRRLFDPADGERVPAPMSDVIEELRSVLQVVAKSRNVAMTLDTAGPASAVSMDRLRIQHVIYSLLQNAVDACAAIPDGARVSIDVRADRHAVETSVTDSGPGIPAAARDHIFRPFYTTKPRGTGLGLASCRAIIEAHGGTIGFENLDGGGCRFWFRLPTAGP